MAENLVSYVDVWRLAVLRSAGDWRRLRRQVLNAAVQNAPTQRSLPGLRYAHQARRIPPDEGATQP